MVDFHKQPMLNFLPDAFPENTAAVALAVG
jgi:hypothetical protein